jgi:D-sedoheptulose 7-phosphate isomerase
MEHNYYAHYSRSIERALANLEVTQAGGHLLSQQEGFNLACSMAVRVRDDDGMLYFCGNGASAAMASHMALDWLKNSGVKAACFNDIASLTAYGNDTCYDNVFALPLKRLGRATDVLITTSSSGNSPNVLAALTQAKASGIRTITFSGLGDKNKSRAIGDLNFFIPCRTYGIAECAHQILLHAWLDQFMGIEEWTNPSK